MDREREHKEVTAIRSHPSGLGFCVECGEASPLWDFAFLEHDGREKSKILQAAMQRRTPPKIPKPWKHLKTKKGVQFMGGSP